MDRYTETLAQLKAKPVFSIGQEVKTPDGMGVIVSLEMKFNPIYVSLESAEAVVWYSADRTVRRESGGSWAAFTYKLSELSELKPI